MTPQLIGSHYLIEDQIGQGGMGMVWRGRDTATGARYAIKVLRPEYARDTAAVARFVRERTALVLFRHPNVVTLHDMVVEGEQLALVMDLVEGGDLGDRLRARGGALGTGEAAELIAQVCDALTAAHRARIVHRDLKPANVLMDGGQVRLGDFGVARIAGEAAITTAGLVVGTVAYLPPEAIRGQEPGPAGDVYAAGITLYELLTGQPPFRGQVAAVMQAHLHTTPDRPAGIPGPLWELILACLSKDPDRRPTAAALARALRDPAFALEGLPPAGAGHVVRDRSPRRGRTPEARRPPRPLAVPAAATALDVGGSRGAPRRGRGGRSGAGGIRRIRAGTPGRRGDPDDGSARGDGDRQRGASRRASHLRPRSQLADACAGPLAGARDDPERVREPRQRLPHGVGDAHQDGAAAGLRVDVRRGRGRHARQRPAHRPDAAGLYPCPRRCRSSSGARSPESTSPGTSRSCWS